MFGIRFLNLLFVVYLIVVLYFWVRNDVVDVGDLFIKMGGELFVSEMYKIIIVFIMVSLLLIKIVLGFYFNKEDYLNLYVCI